MSFKRKLKNKYYREVDINVEEVKKDMYFEEKETRIFSFAKVFVPIMSSVMIVVLSIIGVLKFTNNFTSTSNMMADNKNDASYHIGERGEDNIKENDNGASSNSDIDGDNGTIIIPPSNQYEISDKEAQGALIDPDSSNLYGSEKGLSYKPYHLENASTTTLFDNYDEAKNYLDSLNVSYELSAELFLDNVLLIVSTNSSLKTYNIKIEGNQISILNNVEGDYIHIYKINFEENNIDSNSEIVLK